MEKFNFEKVNNKEEDVESVDKKFSNEMKESIIIFKDEIKNISNDIADLNDSIIESKIPEYKFSQNENNFFVKILDDMVSCVDDMDKCDDPKDLIKKYYSLIDMVRILYSRFESGGAPYGGSQDALKKDFPEIYSKISNLFINLKKTMGSFSHLENRFSAHKQFEEINSGSGKANSIPAIRFVTSKGDSLNMTDTIDSYRNSDQFVTNFEKYLSETLGKMVEKAENNQDEEYRNDTLDKLKGFKSGCEEFLDEFEKIEK